MLAFIGIFCVSFFGILILNKLDKHEIKDYFIIYPVLLVLTNALSIFIFRLRYGYIEDYQTNLNLDATFFIRYCLVGLFLQILLIIGYIVIDKVLDIKVITENEKTKNNK